MIGTLLIVWLFTLLGVLLGWKARGTWDEVGAAYAHWSGGDGGGDDDAEGVGDVA